MNCAEISEKLDEFVDGELEPRLSQTVAAHVADCPSCRGELGRLESVRELVRQVQIPPATAALDASVKAAFRRHYTPHPVSRPVWHRLFFASVRVPAPVLALGLLLLAGGAIATFQAGRSAGGAGTITAGGTPDAARPDAAPPPTREVPVVQERVVYIPVKANYRGPHDSTPTRPTRARTVTKRAGPQPARTQLAASPETAEMTTQVALEGFEPVTYAAPRILPAKGERQ